MMLGIGPREVHLWCSFPPEIGDGEPLGAYRALLSEAERETLRRFHFSRDRRRYTVTRALVRTVLSRYSPETSPGDWEFVAGPYGRPHIRHDHPAALRLRFNITHTDDAVFLAVALDRELGVDVESTARREPSLQIADHHFARAEAAALYALPAEQRQSRFFEYWTLKEAYIKARSMGLFLPLNSFSFHFPTTTQVELRLDEGHPDRASRWRFRQLSISPSLVVAICEERQGGAQSTLVATKTVPLVSDRELPYTLLRESVEDGSVQ